MLVCNKLIIILPSHENCQLCIAAVVGHVLMDCSSILIYYIAKLHLARLFIPTAKQQLILAVSVHIINCIEAVLLWILIYHIIVICFTGLLISLHCVSGLIKHTLKSGLFTILFYIFRLILNPPVRCVTGITLR